MKTNKKRNMIFWVLLCSILSFFIIYFIMFFSTTPLLNYVESIYKGEVKTQQISNTWYEDFNIKKHNENIKNVDITINRVFVCHNFKKGFMIVKINCQAFDSEDEVVYGDYCYEKWEIIKNKSGWQIVDVKQKSGGTIL